VIFALGLYLANLARQAVSAMGGSKGNLLDAEACRALIKEKHP
jgi:hypothetical protein